MSEAASVGRLPGFRDFPPEALVDRARIFEAWRRVSRRYGFVEYDGPPLESLDLYVRKSGEEIVGQLYEFTDKGGRQVALRPEMTPSLARILAERSRALPKPIRWFSIPQLFRYERQQRGRLREHFQWNVDVVGEAGVGADAEVLAVALDGLRALGLRADDIVARVSDRLLLTALLTAEGVEAGAQPAVFQVIDKLERGGEDWARDRLRDDAGMDPAGAARLLELIGEGSIERVRAEYGDRPNVVERLTAMTDYLSDLEALGLGDFVQFDLGIVRGLAYYTGIVFEIFDRERTLRAICGGGRYDRLLELVGGEPLPAVGFGMGDVVLAELLQEKGLRDEQPARIDAFVVAASPKEHHLALEVAAALRAQGQDVSYALKSHSVRKQFKMAAAAGAAAAIVLGPREVEEGMVSVRDMDSGEERAVALTELLAGRGLADAE